MFVAERDIAAGPGVGYTVRVPLTQCWADSAHARRMRAEGIQGSNTPCGNPADEAGIGLCLECLDELVGTL